MKHLQQQLQHVTCVMCRRARASSCWLSTSLSVPYCFASRYPQTCLSLIEAASHICCTGIVLKSALLHEHVHAGQVITIPVQEGLHSSTCIDMLACIMLETCKALRHQTS